MSRQSDYQINLDCRQFGSSGIGTYIENLIYQYQKNDFEFNFRLLVRKEHRDILSKRLRFPLNEYNEEIYSIGEQFGWVTKIDPFGILHVPHYNAPLLYPGKLIITVHDVCHLAMRQFFPGLLKRLYSNLFFKRILVKADHIVTVSNFSKSEITRYFDIDPEKISVIYNGVSPDYRPIPKEESENIIRQYNLPDEFILFLGNLKPHKNIVGLVTSYREAVAMSPDLPPLVILGNDYNMFRENPGLKEAINDRRIRERLIFTGFLPTEVLPAIYSRALLFLLPSFYEGFGLTVLEAMACGTPVITSNCSSIPEVVEDAAMLINPYNNREIAQGIVRMLTDNDLQNEYVSRGFNQVQKYTWEKSALEHFEIYDRIAEVPAPVRRAPRKAVTAQPRHNILFLDQYGDRVGGGQVILLDILEKFRSSHQWNVFVSVPEEGKFTKLLSDHGFSPFIIKTWEPGYREIYVVDIAKYILSSIKSSYFIGRLVRKYNISVIYCNGGRTYLNGTFISLLFSLKLFIHLHLFLEERQKRAVKIFGRLPGVKSIFAVSKLLENQYLEHPVYNKMCVISNWVSPELLTTKLTSRSDQICTPIRFGIVGQISKVKGQWTVLQALLKLDTVLPISLSLYGEPLIHDNEHWQEIQTMIEELQQSGWQVDYRGFKSNKLDIYNELDALIIPSLVPESFGLTAIEAMAREVLVITNRSGALTEIIKNRENGFLYNAESGDELIEIIRMLLDGQVDIRLLREKGLNTVKSKYHPEKQLDMLHDTVFSAVTGKEVSVKN